MLRLYVNGIEASSSSTAGALLARASDIVVGADTGGGNPFAGVLDEVAVYDRALSPQAIAKHHAAGLGD